MNMGILSYSYRESEVSVRLKPDAQSCKMFVAKQCWLVAWICDFLRPGRMNHSFKIMVHRFKTEVPKSQVGVKIK